ncbi:MAG: hypothetical protein AAGC74_02280 [Verrucomicrobiota bacterium]
MRPTFPVSEKALAKKRRQTIFGSALTWASLLPSFGAWTLLDAPPWAAGLGLLATLGGLIAYWKQHLDKQEPHFLDQLIAQSNAEQDQALHHHAQQLFHRGHVQAARILRHTIGLKQDIESQVHREAATMHQRERLDTLVDRITFALVDKLEQQTQSPSPQTDYQITQAIQKLEQTLSNLPNILNPSAALPQHNPDPLQQALDELAQESSIADSVKKRLLNDWKKSPASLSSPGNESPRQTEQNLG